MVSDEEFDKTIELLVRTNKSPCSECFCSDLCIFVLLKAGQITSCKDWQNRVRKVVNRELNKK